MRTWRLLGSLPPKDDAKHSWRENKECIVVAETCERALQLVRAKHATLVIWSIHHQGKVDYIEDAP